MHLIQIKTVDPSVVEVLKQLSENNENIDIIQGHNFSGDLSNIELYVELSIAVIAAITPIITALIKNSKVTSIKVDNDKIELTNASSKNIEEFIQKFLTNKQTAEEATYEAEADRIDIDADV